MTDWLDMPLQTHDLATPEGRDGLRGTINTLDAATKSIVESLLREEIPIFVSYTFGYVPPGKALDGSDGLEAVLWVSSAQTDPRMTGVSGEVIGDLITKVGTFIDIAELFYGTGTVAEVYLRDYPAYVKIIQDSPVMGITAKFSSEQIPLDIR